MLTLNRDLLRRHFYRAMARRPVTLQDLASKSWVLCPEQETIIPPAICLAGETDRILGLSPWRNPDSEQRLIAGGTCHHAASVAYLVEDVALVDSHLYSRAAAAHIGFGERRLLIDAAPSRQYIREGHLITGKTGSHFFGNLMLDDYPLALLPDCDSTSILMMTRPYLHDAEYRCLMGLSCDPPVTRARVARLTIYTDFAQNSLKEARYRELRHRLRIALGSESPRPTTGVYLRRGRSGEPRLLTNEHEIEQFLAALGFDIVDPESLPAREISLRLLDAPMVVSVEGSHLSHAIYSLGERATFLVLQPPERFAMAYKEYTDRVGMRFAFVVGDRSPSGFTISAERLARLLDLVGREHQEVL